MLTIDITIKLSFILPYQATMSDLLPPDEAEYAIQEDLITKVQEHAFAHRYAITIQRFCKRDGVLILSCDRGGKYWIKHRVVEPSGLRNTSSKYI
jgi:hypothetical protein